MDPHDVAVKNPYAHVSIPRAHLRPDLGQQLEAPPFAEMQPLPVGPFAPEPTHFVQSTEVPGPTDAKGGKGAKGAGPLPSQATWQQPSDPCRSTGQPVGLTYAGLPPIGRNDDIAHHCCCCPCCSCCHCPRCCRCHRCCCVVS